MAWELVGEGSVVELANLSQYEDQLTEGSLNLLQLILRAPVSQDMADTLEDALREAGVEGVKVETASPELRIYFRKGFPWLAVIAAIILASLVVIALVISWKLFTYVGGVAPGAVPLLILAATVGAIALAIYMVRRPV